MANSQVKPSIPDADLKRLLQVVKDSRVSLNPILCPTLTDFPLRQKQPHDAKLVDPFYDALEDLLHDLRTVTMVLSPPFRTTGTPLTSSGHPG